LRITIEPTNKTTPQYYPRTIIEVATDELNLEEMLNYLVKPALLAIGYSPELVASLGDAYEGTSP
jgi:hypothetical protein